MRVAGAQMPVTSCVAENRDTILRAVAFAREESAEILLTPEGSLSGYRPDFDRDEVADALEAVLTAARAAHLALALGTCFAEPADGLCYNQVRFYSADGAFLGFHGKTLRCGSLEDPPRGEIEWYAPAPLRTFDVAGVTVGALICNDLWANPGCTPMPDPHLTQELARAGARVVFHAVNGGRDGAPLSAVAWRYHESNLLLRALAGGIWIVTVDNCHPGHIDCSAPSGVVTPEGRWALRCPERGERLFVCTLPL